MTHRRAGKPWVGGGGGGGMTQSPEGMSCHYLFSLAWEGGGALAAEYAPAMEMFWIFS